MRFDRDPPALLRKQTIEQQVLPALGRVRDLLYQGVPVGKAFVTACFDVARTRGVTHQTIRDSLTRRLDLDADELQSLAQKWLEGSPEPLRDRLHKHTDPSLHKVVSTFLASNKTEIQRETVCIKLPQFEALMLRALADGEGVSLEEFVGQMMRGALAAKMKAVAHQLAD